MIRPRPIPPVRPLILLFACVAVLLPALTAPADAVTDLRLDGVHVHLPAGSKQVVTVNHTSGHHARVTLWRKTGHGWAARVHATDGRIGYGGLVARTKRHQGTGTTPIGTFGLPFAFGRHAKHGDWNLRYRRIHRGDYWVEDNTSAHYNRYRNKSQGGFHWRLPAGAKNGSERLRDYPKQYEFAVVVKYNWGQVRHRGAGIFLHVNGSGATAGCVSAPRWFLKQTLSRLDPRLRPVIAIGR